MKTKLIISIIVLLGVFVSCKQKPADQAVVPETRAAAPAYQKMITARVFIKPGFEEEFITSAQWIIDNTHKEGGCIEYTLYQDPNNRSNFFFFEKYRDQAAIDFHFAASYFKEFGDKIAEMTSQPTEIKIIDIAGEK
ncbi:MAG: putative quinol monooxygenase [Bacteroidota bacterium]